MFDGLPSEREGPPQVDPRRGVPAARARARRGARRGDGDVDQLQHGVDVDLRAAPHVRVPEAPRARRACGATRHDQPYHVVGSDAVGCGAARRAPRCATGSRATRSPCTATHVDDQDPSAHDDSMMATNQRIWGFETNFGGLAEISGREGEPADAEARAPHVGRGRGQRAHQLHELPHDREPERLADDAGPDRAHLGRERRHRRVRVPVRAQRRRHSGRRRVVAGARRAAARAGRRGRDRPQGRGLQVLERRGRAGPEGVAAVRQEDPRARRHATPTSCSSTPVARRWARRCSSRSAAA